MRSEPLSAKTLEQLRARLAGVGDGGWLFSQIAEQVSARRAALGMSQRELAELVSTTQSAIARLEAGGRPPRIDTLLRIAAALDCELSVELRPHPHP
jgi:ribosome-binding protein aMBF1 (putative translation factor)